MRRINRLLALLAFAALPALLWNQAHAKLVAMSTMQPVKDALTKVEQWIKDHPKDANGYYTLGRVHALAWGYGDQIPLLWFNRENLPLFSEHATIRIARDWSSDPFISVPEDQRKARGPESPEDLAHLQASIDAYTKALALEPDNALYEQGLAWMLQQKGLVRRAIVDEVGRPTDQEKAKVEQALQQLRSAEFDVREAGSKALLEAMPRCAPLLAALKAEDAEVQSRIAGVFAAYWDLQALPHYRHAYALTAAKDAKLDFVQGVDGLISRDAAFQMVQILSAHPAAARPGELTELKSATEELAKKGQFLLMDW